MMSLFRQKRGLRLRVTRGVDIDRVYDVGTREVRIGRSELCEIRLNDPDVANVQLTIFPRRSGGYTYERSVEGQTSVNGRTARQGVLKPGAIIKLGRTEIAVEAGEPLGDAPVEASTTDSPEPAAGAAPRKPRRQSGEVPTVIVYGLFAAIVGGMVLLRLATLETTSRVPEAPTRAAIEMEVIGCLNAARQAMRESDSPVRARAILANSERDLSLDYFRLIDPTSDPVQQAATEARLIERVDEAFFQGWNADSSGKSDLARSYYDRVQSLIPDPGCETTARARSRSIELAR